MKKRNSLSYYLIIGSVVIALSIIAGLVYRNSLQAKIFIFDRYTDIKRPSLGFGTLSTPPAVVSPISLGEIFSNSKITPTNNRIELIATGDVIPARSVNYQTTTRNDFLWPYMNIQDILASADLTLVNLESPLLITCPVTNEGMIFCGDSRNIEGLVASSVDIANIANNHFGNYGQTGIQESKTLLEKSNIQVSGAGNVAKQTVKGVTFSFVGFNDIGEAGVGIDKADDEVIVTRITQAKGESDVVVASFHWGVEYTHDPSIRQIELAHKAIDSGADLVIGNHPHWMQPVEIYKKKVIMYAHGNTVFDQMWSDETRLGVLGNYIFEGQNLVDIEFIPIRIDLYGQANVLTGSDKTHRLEILKKISYEFDKRITNK